MNTFYKQHISRQKISQGAFCDVHLFVVYNCADTHAVVNLDLMYVLYLCQIIATSILYNTPSTYHLVTVTHLNGIFISTRFFI